MLRRCWLHAGFRLYQSVYRVRNAISMHDLNWDDGRLCACVCDRVGDCIIAESRNANLAPNGIGRALMRDIYSRRIEKNVSIIRTTFANCVSTVSERYHQPASNRSASCPCWFFAIHFCRWICSRVVDFSELFVSFIQCVFSLSIRLMDLITKIVCRYDVWMCMCVCGTQPAQLAHRQHSVIIWWMHLNPIRNSLVIVPNAIMTNMHTGFRSAWLCRSAQTSVRECGYLYANGQTHTGEHATQMHTHAHTHALIQLNDKSKRDSVWRVKCEVFFHRNSVCRRANEQHDACGGSIVA